MELQNLLKEMLSEYDLETMVEDIVSDMIYKKVDYHIERAIETRCEEIARDKGNSYIKEKIENVISGEVLLSDGWGNEKRYDSFDSFVKHKIAKELNSSWNVERKVREAVDDRIKKFVKEVTATKMEARVDEVVELLAEDILKNEKE